MSPIVVLEIPLIPLLLTVVPKVCCFLFFLGMSLQNNVII